MRLSPEERSRRIAAGLAEAKARGVRIGTFATVRPDRDQIHALLDRGLTAVEAAKQLGCTFSWVRQTFGKVGSRRLCKRGHLMAETRRFSPNGDPYCGTCKRLRSKEEIKRRTPEYSRQVQRRSHIKTAYGMTVEQYDAMLITQNGVCAICSKPSSNKKRLHIDHEHATGAIRGLLCHSCNTGLGLLRDDPILLVRCLEYLKTRNKEILNAVA
jgi:hypothetical protein